MASSSANVETRAPVPAAGLLFLGAGTVGGVGATKWSGGCAAALGGGVTRSGDRFYWFMVELLPEKLGTCIGPC